MKKFIKIILVLLVMFGIFSVSYAQQGRWTDRGSTPFEILSSVVGEANSDHDKIQYTALDNVSDTNSSWNKEYKISRTLDDLRTKIGPYIQRAVYIGLIASTTGLIICGFLMVTGGLSNSEGFKKVKGRIVNALLGVFVLSGFYLLIKFIMSIINYFVE